MIYLYYDVLHDFPIFSPSLREVRLGGFGLLDMFRIGFFGLVSYLAY